MTRGLEFVIGVRGGLLRFGVFAHHGALEVPMTEWIDNLAKKQDAQALAASEQRRIQLLHADIITARLPDFYREVVIDVKALAKELDEKIGASVDGVTCSGNLTVQNGHTARGHRVTLELKLDAAGHQILATRRITGSGYVGDGETDRYEAKVNATEAMFVQSRTGKRYLPSEVASDVMKWAFGDILSLG